MTEVDLTLIVTAHDETLVCGPTMRSADLAVTAARAAGHVVQTIVALDKPTEETKAYFHQPAFDHWERRVMGEGDLGRVRNALVPEVDGRYIAFLDADDMFSENWLVEGIALHDAAAERGERVIAHPEVNMVFDGIRAVLHNVDQDSPLFTPYFLYLRNCYDSLCMTPREAHLAVPYVHRDIPERALVPGLAVRHRDDVPGLEARRSARHGHLQAPARLLPDDREQAAAFPGSVPPRDRHRPDPEPGAGRRAAVAPRR